MDKSWMNLARNSVEYQTGLHGFLQFAFSKSSRAGKILCPCQKCCMGISVSKEEAYEHLTVIGFIRGYTNWIAHGELYEGNTFTTDNISSTNSVNNEMEDMLHDLFPEGSDVNETVGETPIIEAANFYKLIEDSQQPLYQGCKKFSKLSQILPVCAGSTSNAQVGHSKKKGRGPTYMAKIWGRPNYLPKIKIMVDMDDNIVSGKTQFSEFLGSLARNSTYCPLVKEAWSEVENKYEKDIMEVINQRFDLPPQLAKWTLQSVGRKWRTWKAELKSKYYKASLPVSEAKNNKDVRVDEEQWNALWTYWGTDDAKKVSIHCQNARDRKKMNHTTGKTSFSTVRTQLENESGRTPTRVEMFCKVYSHSDGRPSSRVVAEKLEMMKEKMNELSPDHEDVVSRNDIFSQITGKDKPGYVRLYGDGVHPNDTWSKSVSRSKLLRENIRQQTQLKMLEEKFEERFKAQAATIAMLQAQADARRGNNETPESPRNIPDRGNNIISTRSAQTSNEFRVGREVLLKSFFDVNKNIARGYIRSTDPLVVLHGCPLGPNWFEVEVKTVIDGDEHLIRPFYPLETIQDALGASIAWPKHLVSAYYED